MADSRVADLEKQVDEITGQIIALWHHVKRIRVEIIELKNEGDRQSRDAFDRYRDEMPSETKLSLHPTGIRILWKNARPSTALVIVVILVLGIVALVWILRPR